jgi:phosphoesterase RecJ-like protein
MITISAKRSAVRITKEIAECVTLALVTDTGSFHFPNTTDRTLKVASELVKVGVKPAQISEAVYNSYPGSSYRVDAASLKYRPARQNGRVAWMRQTLEMRENSGMTDGAITVSSIFRSPPKKSSLQFICARSSQTFTASVCARKTE